MYTHKLFNIKSLTQGWRLFFAETGEHVNTAGIVYMSTLSSEKPQWLEQSIWYRRIIFRIIKQHLSKVVQRVSNMDDALAKKTEKHMT